MNLLTTMFFFFLILFSSIAGHAPDHYYAADNIAINCGSSSKSVALDGREWAGDTGSQYGRPVSLAKASESLFTDHVPYSTARISMSQFSYKFRVSPGQKFVRLHFYPASYPGFDRSKALFTVKAGPYTLLSNFSASLNADGMGLKSFSKEFCLNVEENQILGITFSPSPAMYAFINGIEVVSMPTDLYYTPDSDPGAPIIGRKRLLFDIDNGTALEGVHRLNIGGSSILPIEDTGMFRRWSGESASSLQLGVMPIATTIPIKYKNVPAYAAPQRVYQSASLTDPNKLANKIYNLTWKLPVDVGFRYLVRLHFCELDYGIMESGHREFDIFINNRAAETLADIIKWSGGNGVPVYKDYVVIMEGDRIEGKRDLIIALQPHYSESRSNYPTGAILNGLEVLKLSNPDSNLAGQNLEPSAKAPTPITTKLQKLQQAFWNRNGIVGSLIILINLLSIFVYQLRLWAEKFDEKDISSSLLSSSEFGRRFSLSEIQLATNNFDDALVIGNGGFGKVYKGQMDKGSIAVAIKRLKSMSKQGADEFWTEIKTLSKLRHINLVTLIGYCDDNQEMILVYEYMINGTIADHLHKRGEGRMSPLSWEQRLHICIGAARGLEYLHTGAEHRVIHRDVKTSNILLDENLVAKISDFGLSKMGGNTINQSSTYVITDVKGTFGYLDVEYFLTHRLTRKSDVYAFGVVLFEVLCGRPALDKRLEGEERSLALWAQHCIKEGSVNKMIDPCLKGKILPHSLKVFVEVAHKCLHSRPNERPRMSAVVQKLEFALSSNRLVWISSNDQFGYPPTDTKGEKEHKEAATDIDEAWTADSEQIDGVTEGEPGEAFDFGRAENTKIDGTENSNNSQLSMASHPSEQQTDGSAGINGAQQPKGSINLVHDSMPEIPTERSNKKTVMKIVHNIAKGMDIQRKKTKSNGSKSRSSWWWSKASPRTEITPLPEEPDGVVPVLPRLLSLAEIRGATRNFSPYTLIDGEWYRGHLDDGKLQVAIQRCRKEKEKNSVSEVEKRSQLHNIHLVSFIGYLKEEGEMILVYEFMMKGKLCSHLYGSRISPLPWKKRLDICVGAARGLHYLHQGNIVHGDLKSSKILLDDNWVAKISGLQVFKEDEDDASGITHTVVTAVVRNTLGYMDPEYLMFGHLTAKSDVYSFGVVLLEVLCARKAMDLSLPQRDRVLVQWFKQSIKKKITEQVIDPNLMGKIEPKCLRKFVETALSCLHDQGKERPSMDAVVGSLQSALQLQETLGDQLDFGTMPGDPPEKLHAAAARAYKKVLFHNGKKLLQ